VNTDAGGGGAVQPNVKISDDPGSAAHTMPRAAERKPARILNRRHDSRASRHDGDSTATWVDLRSNREAIARPRSRIVAQSVRAVRLTAG
jgi:hypothetical protein